jgi:UDP-N-acetylmuramoylalanine--D-glutamate ligase
VKILVLGAGESGLGASLLAKSKGFEVLVSDSQKIKEEVKNVLNKADINWEEGHSSCFDFNPDLVVKSPGIPGKVKVVKTFKEEGVPVISEVEFASRFTQGKIVAITGTNGKTTTSSLTYHILKKAGLDVALGGNIGVSFARLLAERDYDYFVLEVSSFQLDDIEQFKPDIAVLLNITPDHLDRYEYDMQKYIDAKFRITENQDEGDHFIYTLDNDYLEKEVEKREIKANKHPISYQREVENGAFIKNERIRINITDKPFDMSIHELALQGRHNAYNSMAASIAARILEIRKDLIRESLSDFQNVEHRLEFVAKIHGIKFINDSKATNVNSTWYALESANDPIVWIVGGVDKGNDYSILKDLVQEKVKAIVCLGADNQKLIEFFQPIVPNISEAKSADEAVGQAYRWAQSGDTVLLSPACASFDLFDNYEDRGHQYKRAIRAL